MRKFILFTIALLLTLSPFVEANEDGSIEHIGWDTILTYDWESITLKDKSIDYNSQNCPEWYHKATAEDWSKLINMRYKIDWSNYKYLNQETDNDFYSVKEEWVAGEIIWEDNVWLYAFKNDVLNGDQITYFRTTSKGYQNKPYIFVYQEPESCLSGTVWYWKDAHCWYIKIKRCTTVYVKPKKERNVCNENLKTRCFKDDENENDSDKNDNDSDSDKNDNDNNNNNSIINNWYSEEFNDAYAFAYENWITTMKTIEETNMNGWLDRIAMAKMLSKYAINILWKELDSTKQCNFNDVSAQMDSSYDNWVTLACQLWIMWVWMTNFRPNDDVTRAEFWTALSRMLYGLADWTDQYYSTHLAKLKKEWIISNDNPTLKELRWYVMLMLMRSAK